MQFLWVVSPEFVWGDTAKRDAFFAVIAPALNYDLAADGIRDHLAESLMDLVMRSHDSDAPVTSFVASMVHCMAAAYGIGTKGFTGRLLPVDIAIDATASTVTAQISAAFSGDAQLTASAAAKKLPKISPQLAVCDRLRPRMDAYRKCTKPRVYAVFNVLLPSEWMAPAVGFGLQVQCVRRQ